MAAARAETNAVLAAREASTSRLRGEASELRHQLEAKAQVGPRVGIHMGPTGAPGRLTQGLAAGFRGEVTEFAPRT